MKESKITKKIKLTVCERVYNYKKIKLTQCVKESIITNKSS